MTEKETTESSTEESTSRNLTMEEAKELYSLAMKVVNGVELTAEEDDRFEELSAIHLENNPIEGNENE